MKERNKVTQKDVLEMFDYSDGNLIRRKAISQCKEGDIAGHINKKLGYVLVQFMGKLWFAHRLIFLYHKGYLPDKSMVIDHIDGNPLNNRIENLRECTQQDNCKNKRAGRNSSSSYTGVCWDKKLRKWKANIKVEGKTKHIGMFTDEWDAATAYNEYAKTYHKEFARLNVKI